jgi:phage-related holin
MSEDTLVVIAIACMAYMVGYFFGALEVSSNKENN